MCSAQEEGKDEEGAEWCHAYFLQVKIPEFSCVRVVNNRKAGTIKEDKE
jgi:hypothetical protein